MKKEYDFTSGRRGSVVRPAPGKDRITIRLDRDILDWFRDQCHAAGGGSYQTMINEALRRFIETSYERLEDTVRKVVREELTEYGPKRSVSLENEASPKSSSLETLFREAQQQLRITLAKLPPAETAPELLSLYFGSKAYWVGQSVEVLCAVGNATEARILLRALVDHYINYRYIMQDPIRADEFIRFAPIDAWKWLRSIRGSNIWGFSEEQLDTWAASIRPAYESERKNFLDSRGRDQRTWHGRTIRALAGEVGDGLPELYEVVFRDTSQFVHPSNMAAAHYLDASPDGTLLPVLDNPRSRDDAPLVTSLATKLNIDMVARLNDYAKLTDDEAIVELDRRLMNLLKAGIARPQAAENVIPGPWLSPRKRKRARRPNRGRSAR